MPARLVPGLTGKFRTIQQQGVRPGSRSLTQPDRLVSESPEISILGGHAPPRDLRVGVPAKARRGLDLAIGVAEVAMGVDGAVLLPDGLLGVLRREDNIIHLVRRRRASRTNREARSERVKVAFIQALL